MSPQGLDYFRARAAEERQRAAETTDPKTRAIHLELAARYSQAVTDETSENLLGGAREVIQRSLDLLRTTNAQATSQ